jgi:hypothetical protein
MGEDSDDWEFQRIGTESEKSSVEKELAELRERLAKVEEWKSRKAESKLWKVEVGVEVRTIWGCRDHGRRSSGPIRRCNAGTLADSFSSSGTIDEV